MAWVRNAVAEDTLIEQRNEAQLNLAETIDTPDATRDELEIAYQQAKQLGAVDADLEEYYADRVASLARRRKAIIVGALVAVNLIIGLLVVGIVLANLPTEVSIAEREQNRNDSLAQALNKIRIASANDDVKPLVEQARKYAITNEERREIDRLEAARRGAAGCLERAEEARIRQRSRRSEGGRGRAHGRRRGAAASTPGGLLRPKNSCATAKKLRPVRRESGYDEQDLSLVENSLAETDRWKTVAATVLFGVRFYPVVPVAVELVCPEPH